MKRCSSDGIAGDEKWEDVKLFNVYDLILDKFADCYSMGKCFAKRQ